jgi:hypothetical protein
MNERPSATCPREPLLQDCWTLNYSSVQASLLQPVPCRALILPGWLAAHRLSCCWSAVAAGAGSCAFASSSCVQVPTQKHAAASTGHSISAQHDTQTACTAAEHATAPQNDRLVRQRGQAAPCSPPVFLPSLLHLLEACHTVCLAHAWGHGSAAPATPAELLAVP